MNTDNFDEPNQEDIWSWSAAPAIPVSDGRIWSKLLAYDGEYAVSYVYEHPNITSKGSLIYEVDAWLADLWRAPSGYLYAVGEGGKIHKYKNGNWHVSQTSEKSMLSSVWGLDDQNIYTTGEGFILCLENEKWVYATRDHNNYIDRLRGVSNDDLYAVGRRGLMLHFDGKSWNRIDVPTNMDLNAIHPIDSDNVYVVGAEGIVLVGSKNCWKVLNFGEIDFVDVMAYQGNIYIAATEKGVFRLSNDDLIPLRNDIRATRLTADGSVLCVAGGLSINTFDGKGWESYTYSLQS